MSLSLLLLKQEQVTMNPIESILSRYPLMVLDCALGTEIAKRGLIQTIRFGARRRFMSGRN